MSGAGAPLLGASKSYDADEPPTYASLADARRALLEQEEREQAAQSTLPRRFLLCINVVYLVFAVVVAGLVGVTTRASNEGSAWAEMIPNGALHALTAAAFVLVVAALAGLYGALASSKPVLYAYGVFSCLALVVELAAALASLAFIGTLSDKAISNTTTPEFWKAAEHGYEQCCPPAMPCANSTSGNFDARCAWAAPVLGDTVEECEAACASVSVFAEDTRSVLTGDIRPAAIAVLALCVPQLLAVAAACVIACRHKAGPPLEGDDEEDGPIVDDAEPEPELDYWPFVLVFKNPEKVKKRKAKKKAEQLFQRTCEALVRNNLRIYLYYSADRSEIFCKVTALRKVLEAEADRTDYRLRLDPAALKAADIAKNEWRREHIRRARERGGPPPMKMTIPEDYETTGSSFNPYRFVYAPYEREAPEQLYRRCRLTRSKFREVDVIYLITSIIEEKAHVILDSLEEYFPLHNETKKQQLEKVWYKWIASPWAQPIQQIRNYYGEKIALYFAWLSMYTQWLLTPALVGLVVYVHQRSVDNFSVRELPVFGVFIAVWSTFFIEFWKRKQARYALMWGMDQFEEEEGKRPQFLLHPGRKVGPSPVTGVREVGYSRLRYRSKILFSQLVIATLVCIVLVCIFSIFCELLALLVVDHNDLTHSASDLRALLVKMQDNKELPPNAAGYIASTVNAIQIQVLNLIYGRVARWLNDFENHPTDTVYEDNLIAKTFLFQFVNSYFSLFYIAFIKNHITLAGSAQQCALNAHGEVDCMAELANNLGVIFATRLVVGNFTEIVLPFIKDWVMEKRAQKARAEEIEAAAAEGREPTPEIELSTAEEQNEMDDYDLLSDYAEMAIQYGYITLFVVAFPIAPALALVSNYVELRVDAKKLLTRCCRPTPAGAEDLGTWLIVLDSISKVAVITNSAAVVFTAATPPFGIPQQYYVWAFVVLEHFVFMLKWAVDRFVPDVPYEVSLQLDRQNYLVKKHIEGLDVDEDAKENVPDEEVEDVAERVELGAAVETEEIEVMMTPRGVDRTTAPSSGKQRRRFTIDPEDRSTAALHSAGGTSEEKSE